MLFLAYISLSSLVLSKRCIRATYSVQTQSSPSSPAPPPATSPAAGADDHHTPTPSGTVTTGDFANTINDCWINHNGQAYDFTAWAQSHPGGPDSFTKFCGVNDGTFGAAFHKEHSSTLAAKHKLLSSYCPNADKNNILDCPVKGKIVPGAATAGGSTTPARVLATTGTTGNGSTAGGIPASLTEQIRKDAKFKKLSDLGTDAHNRVDNSWMSTCTQGYAFCCWQVGNGGNANQCSPKKKIHCHGVVIKNKTPQEFLYSQLTLNYVQVYDHYEKRNYFQPLAGAHSCDCGENMPQVSRSDASEMRPTPAGKQVVIDGVSYPDPADPKNFQAAGGNDLIKAYKKEFNKEPTSNFQQC